MIEQGQKYRVAETNRIFGGRIGTVVDIELTEGPNSEFKHPRSLDLEDLDDQAHFRLGLKIDKTGWVGTGWPYFGMHELERIHE